MRISDLSSDVCSSDLHIVFDLVIANIAYIEVLRLGMAEIKARHAGSRIHRIALGKLHADLLGLQHLEHVFLDDVFGTGGITGRRAYTLVFLGDAGFVAERLIWHIDPQIAAHLEIGRALGRDRMVEYVDT